MSDPNHTPAQGWMKPVVPAETLAGDRLCMQCMHPLVGSPITREPATGLLYVRCGECGTASALFEYPTVGPWLKRMKAVASATLIAIMLVVTLVVGGIALGIVVAGIDVGGEISGRVLFGRYRELGGAVDEQGWNGSAWGPANLNWIQSAEGEAELARVRFAPSVVTALAAVSLFASIVLAPFAFTLGVALMRRSVLERALILALIICVAAAIGIVLSTGSLNLPRPTTPSWFDVARERHGLWFGATACAVLLCVGASVAAMAPAVAAAMARFMLPPRDRRLVAWLWEWRGKPVPRN